MEFNFSFAVDRVGHSGGIAVLWGHQAHRQVLNYSRNYINLEISDATRNQWRITGFYGYPNKSRRRASWDMIRNLSNLSPLPWCIIGDFNDMLSSEDKRV